MKMKMSEEKKNVKNVTESMVICNKIKNKIKNIKRIQKCRILSIQIHRIIDVIAFQRTSPPGYTLGS